MSKSLLFLLSLLFLITSLSLFLKASDRQKTAIRPAVPTLAISVSEAKLTLSPNPILAIRGQATQSMVLIEAQGDRTKTVQLEMAFDPSMITNLTLEPGPFFSDPKILLNNIDYNTGRISYALEANSPQKKFEKKAPVVKITFTAIPSAQNGSALYFLPKTTVKDDTETNIMRSAYGSTIVFR